MNKTIDDKIENNEWKRAEDNLKNFNKMMELIKKYPIKSMETPLPNSPYTHSNFCYFTAY